MNRSVFNMDGYCKFVSRRVAGCGSVSIKGKSEEKKELENDWVGLVNASPCPAFLLRGSEAVHYSVFYFKGGGFYFFLPLPLIFSPLLVRYRFSTLFLTFPIYLLVPLLFSFFRFFDTIP